MNLLKAGSALVMAGCSTIALVFLLAILAAIWGVSC